MGITLDQALLFKDWVKKHRLSGTVITLGVQDLGFSYADLVSAVGRATDYRFGTTSAGPMTAVDYFKGIGFDRVIAMDVSDYEGAEIVFDLNNPEPPEHLINSADLIVNGGTLEHVFHLPNALATINRMLKASGAIWHIMPCHNCVDHGFFQFGPTIVFDYYAAAKFDVLESAISVFEDREKGIVRVEPSFEGSFGTGLIGGLERSPILYTALVRKSPQSLNWAVPVQRLYAPQRRPLAATSWFAPFRLEGATVKPVPFCHMTIRTFSPSGDKAWLCAVPGSESTSDSLLRPIMSSLAVFEDGRLLGPPHTNHNKVREDGGGSYSHWNGHLLMSTSDGTDPTKNNRTYEIRYPKSAE